MHAQIFLHFHQFTQSNKKLTTLTKIATENKTFYIFTPTNKLTNIFLSTGFQKCSTIPCPSFIRENIPPTNTRLFSKVLYAGAARKDKGFPEVVELICYTKKIGINLPFEIQISAPNSGRYDKDSQIALHKLKGLLKDNLFLHQQTLNHQQYQELFNNSICLLVYDVNNYHDKFSGVTLDAFYACCPIITVANTWMGDTVDRFKAGITLSTRDPKSILNAITIIQDNYEHYANNAERAALVLAKEHDPKNTLLAIQKQLTLSV